MKVFLILACLTSILASSAQAEVACFLNAQALEKTSAKSYSLENQEVEVHVNTIKGSNPDAAALLRIAIKDKDTGYLITTDADLAPNGDINGRAVTLNLYSSADYKTAAMVVCVNK